MSEMPEMKTIADKLRGNQRTLFMERVPVKTKRLFQELSETEFCGDYGMTLKWLLDYFIINSRIDNLEQKVSAIENNNKKKNDIKMLSGKTLQRR